MRFITVNIFKKGFIALAFYPFIILKNADLRGNKVLVNHEKIHLRQQIEMLIVPFYLWYITEFLIRYVRYGNGLQAYFNLSFEREAYSNEGDFSYLKNRRFWQFLRYL
ncbi:MAG: hypothetical protein Q4F57_05860 [Weeksellaceae bacterium]|nr:hypothetical protein [Weeksellaceae bacterium]